MYVKNSCAKEIGRSAKKVESGVCEKHSSLVAKNTSEEEVVETGNNNVKDDPKNVNEKCTNSEIQYIKEELMSFDE